MTVRGCDKSLTALKRSILAAFLLLAVLTLFPAGSGRCFAANLQRVEVLPADESTEVILHVGESVRYLYNYLPATETLPARCYVDLFGTFHDPSPSIPKMGDNRHVEGVRSHLYVNKLRLVIDLKGNKSCTVTSSGGKPFLLTVSVRDPEAAAGGVVGTSRPESSRAGERSRELAEKSASAAIAQDAPAPLTLPVNEIPAESPSATNEGATPDLTSAPRWREKVSTWGWVELFGAVDSREDSAEDQSLFRLKGRLGSDWKDETSPDSSLEWHAAIGVDRIFYDAALADEETEVRLYETYLEFDRAQWDVSFGNQRIRWGKSDQLSPVDSINPQDFRQFITVDLEDRALPSWLLRHRWHGETYGLETIIQPWFQRSELEYFDSDWALYRNLRQSITENPASPPWLKDYARDLHVSEDKPGNSLESLSAAARLSWKTWQADFALSYHYGWETLPTITSFPVKGLDVSGDPNEDPAEILNGAIFTAENVQSEFRRQQTVGFEWESVLDPVGFRGEIAHIDHVALLSSDLTSKRKPVTHLVGGIDYTSADEWYFNLQGSWYHIHDYSRNVLYFERDTVSLLGEVSKPVWRGNLDLALRYNYTITDQSSYLQPAVTLKYFPNVKCEVGAMVFSGDGETLLGSYDQADQVYGIIRFSTD